MERIFDPKTGAANTDEYRLTQPFLRTLPTQVPGVCGVALKGDLITQYIE
jgi:hypothetical protein